MPVYLVRAGGGGPVKIGMTQNADDAFQRMANLQSSHWETLHLLRVWVGGRPEETMLHARFADLHIRGEWFGFSRLMLGDVEIARRIGANDITLGVLQRVTARGEIQPKVPSTSGLTKQ